MLALDPGAVTGAAGADDPDRTDGLVFTHPVSRTSRNGVTGRPSEASAAEGETLLRALGDDFAALLGKARVEIPPLPDSASRSPPDESRPAARRRARAGAAAKGVKFCIAAFVDVHGVPKSKAAPIACFEKMCEGGELYTVGANEGMGLAGPHEDECARGSRSRDSRSSCPWDPRVAFFAADL